VGGSPRSTIYEIGESSKGDVLVGTGDGENGEVGEDSNSKVVLSAMGAAPTLGLYFWGERKG
jgi:hypothetical protein